MNALHNNRLVWTPIYKYVAQKIREQKQLQFIISPFIKRAALTQLLDQCTNTSNLKVIVRWDKADIVKQVSDLEIYEDLRDKGISLYRHPSIHLKMLVFNKNWAFHTSGNITLKGLGLAQDSNIEVGAQIRLDSDDWIQIQQLLAGATLIDDTLYERARKYKESNSIELNSLPPLDLEPEDDPNFSRLSLPALQSPEQLYEIYQAPNEYQDEDELYSAYIHDMALYNMVPALEHEAFYHQLRLNFKTHLFIEAISSFIKGKKSARFGEVNAWIAAHCSDKPTPYRWELKESTNRLYDWLAYFFDEITWERPNYSQIIRWTDSAKS